MLDKPVKDYSDYHGDKDLDDASFNELKKVYKMGLDFPSAKPKKQYLLCPIGLVGSGKSTVVKPLSKKLQLPRISSDEVRELLYQRDFNMKRLAELTTAVIDDCLSLGYSVVIDSDNVNAVNICEAHKHKYGLDIFWIHVNPPEKYILDKLKNYKHTWLFKNPEAAIESYYSRKELHKDLSGFDFIYTFDPSLENLQTQLDEAAEIIQRAAE